MGERETQSCDAEPPTVSAGPVGSSEPRTALQGYKNRKETPSTYTQAIISPWKGTALRDCHITGPCSSSQVRQPMKRWPAEGCLLTARPANGAIKEPKNKHWCSTYVHVLPGFTIESMLQDSLRTEKYRWPLMPIGLSLDC